MSHRKNKHQRTHRVGGVSTGQAPAVFRPSKEKPRLVRHIPKLNMPPPGTSPGIETHELSSWPSTGAQAVVTCVDYCPEQMQLERVVDLGGFLDRHRPAWSKVRWIHVAGLSRMEAIRAFAEKYQLHPLAIEDMLAATQQPKLEDYPGSDDMPGRLFIVGRTVKMDGDALNSEQVSLFLGRSTLLSFMEAPSPVFESIYRRTEVAGSRLRTHDVSFLLHALIDAIIDSYFPVLEHYGECLEDFDDDLLIRPDPGTPHRIHVFKRNLVLLRRSIWPMRELVVQLQRDRHECLSETTLTYFRDIHDHCVQIIDLLETYREIAASLTETYMVAVSNRMNEIMKVLTVIGTIFIPLTFLAGVYGMNMQIPENGWAWSYPVFWAVCIASACGMLVWFRRRGWV
jgi:magnesium transporter